MVQTCIDKASKTFIINKEEKNVLFEFSCYMRYGQNILWFMGNFIRLRKENYNMYWTFILSHLCKIWKRMNQMICIADDHKQPHCVTELSFWINDETLSLIWLVIHCLHILILVCSQRWETFYDAISLCNLQGNHICLNKENHFVCHAIYAWNGFEDVLFFNPLSSAWH